MFRFIRPRQSILALSRVPLSVEARAQSGQAINVQRVKFRKPGMRPRNIAISVLAFYVCYSVYTKVVIEPLDRAAEDALANMPEDELDEDETKPLFIPFPGTTKQLPQKPYRGSDPEWQEFIKFSKDLGNAKRVRDDLAEFVRKSADRHPMLKIRCGSGMKLRRYWLDIDFPQHAPPEFVRSGIEIGDEYIAWAEAPVDSLTVSRIRQALWPSALMKSTWSFVKVMFVDDVKRLGGKLGIQQAPPPPIDQIIARHRQIVHGQSTKEGQFPSPQPIADGTKTTTTVAADKTTAPANGKGPRDADKDMEDIMKHLTGLHAHFIRAIHAFKAKLAQTWRPAQDFPPRGSILVSGFVELSSPKAWLVFDVRAAYDPKTFEFDARSLHLSLRRLQLRTQGPIGGA